MSILRRFLSHSLLLVLAVEGFGAGECDFFDDLGIVFLEIFTEEVKLFHEAIEESWM